MGYTFDFFTGKTGFTTKINDNTILDLNNGKTYFKHGNLVHDLNGNFYHSLGNGNYIDNNGKMHKLNEDPFKSK